MLELCVGPSLKLLEEVYAEKGIEVVGNDIDARWRNYYREGKWILGDALTINYSGFDAVVFAPPLSVGCTGLREDALSIFHIKPSYLEFVERWKLLKGVIGVMVLPGRTFSTSRDRAEYHRLRAKAFWAKSEIMPLLVKDVVKYVDIYLHPT